MFFEPSKCEKAQVECNKNGILANKSEKFHLLRFLLKNDIFRTCVSRNFLNLLAFHLCTPYKWVKKALLTITNGTFCRLVAVCVQVDLKIKQTKILIYYIPVYLHITQI
jgi:hypothetical protein